MADIEQQADSQQPLPTTPTMPSQPVVGQPLEAYYRGLEGVSGAMRIDAPPGTLGTLFVEDGAVRFVAGESAGTAVAFFDDPGDIRPLLRGELNPVVAGLQRRILFDGDRALGARIILGLHTGPLALQTEPLHTEPLDTESLDTESLDTESLDTQPSANGERHVH